ncbi:MAG: preprotein translocase subunit SecA [Bacteroidales bacterium]
MDVLTKVLTKIFGSKSERDIKELMPVVEEINSVYSELHGLSNDELRAMSDNIRQEIKDFISEGEKQKEELQEKAESYDTEVDEKEKLYNRIDELEKQLDDQLEEVLERALPRTFAVMRETAKRFKKNPEIRVTASDFDKELAAHKEYVTIDGDTAIYSNTWEAGGNQVTWDMIHYDVQLMGGIVLHQGRIAEMATGEGKTVAATLPLFLNALAGKGCHLVTVNNYLAKRDQEWMGPLYEFHGLSVDCIDKHEPNSKERRRAYHADITYGTNNEFGFDYLRDNMAINPSDLVQRKHHFSIVDEVDSVLIDDARTPLIISGPVPQESTEQFQDLKPKIERLVNAQKKLVNQVITDARKELKNGNTENGGFKLLQAYKGLPKNKALHKLLSEEGNKALMLKTENYYMQDNSKHMHKVTDDLYFIIDEKSNAIELTDKGIDVITSESDDSNFFILPDIGSELADLEKEDLSEDEKLAKKDELLRDYAVKSERVHTLQQLLKAYTLFDKDEEYVVMDNKVKIVDEQTGRIMEGRRYSDGLHQAIEAKENVKVEAATQTFATITLQNYFRMYHKLAGMTGTAETEAGEFMDIYELDVVVVPTNEPVIREDKDDMVYRTKREKYNAVIAEIQRLIGNGRPVLVGTTSVDVSELLSKMLRIRGVKHNVLNAKLHQKEAEIVAEAGKSRTVTIATNMAGRGTDIKLSPETREAGGLAIVGTERHESRRIDRQLRGRAGRQGDPGSSQFFVSLEDDLMRLFGSDRIASVMARMGLKEGEVIQHSMISRSIERAQRKVEENNYGIRKRLLDYDDVMNSQREVIYKRRKHALFGERLSVDIANMMRDVCEALVGNYQDSSDFEGFKFELIRTLSIDSPVTGEEFLKLDGQEIVDKLHEIVKESYKRKEETIASQANPVIKEVYEKHSHQYENIVVPITDGTKTIQVVTNLKNAYESEGRELVKSYQKNVILSTIDEAWKEHLREMDDLRQSVQNATYEQKDPLLIYKFEAFELFKQMLEKISKEVAATLIKGHIPIEDSEDIQEAQRRRQVDMSQYETKRPEAIASGGGGGGGQRKAEPVKVGRKVGRNELCPCGSGRKYKNCHGRPGAEPLE